jgi:hypothetical protein
MGTTETTDPQDQWDATKATRVPPYLRIPTGDVEVTAQGELLEDEDGNPRIKTQTYLVRRTGKALREIMDLETEIGIQNDKEIEEENDRLDAEDKAREEADKNGEPLPEDKKVDIEWLGKRRQNRNKKTMKATYQSLALLLVNPVTLEHPDPDMLEEHLDFVVAAEWMNVLVPRPEQVQVPVDDEEGETKTVVESPTERDSEEAVSTT